LMCKAILSGDIVGKEFKFEIPFELSGRQAAEEDVSVIHQLAAKVMIQEWQDDGEPYEERHKNEIIELSCDTSVVSRYTAYIAVDEAQDKPVSGSMQSYELTASPLGFGFVSGGEGKKAKNRRMILQSMPIHAEAMMITNDASTMSSDMDEEELSNGYFVDDNLLLPFQSSQYAASSAPPPPKQSDPSFIVSLQQFDGSWLLNDKLAGVVSKSVEELKNCCPVSCDFTMMANIWTTLVVIELLKKKYSSMLEELELVIMKAEQWVGKQILPSGVDLVVLWDGASKVV